MCGVIGIVCATEEVGDSLRAAAQKLYHRSHQCTGAVTFDGTYHEVRGLGMLAEVLNTENMQRLQGRIGLTHLRWATEGALTTANIHPLKGMFRGKPFFVIHNGEISSRRELERRFHDYDPEVTADTKFIVGLIAMSGQNTFEEALQYALSVVKGTYSLILLYENTMYVVRDVTGNRPLYLGVKEGMVCAASESVALSILHFAPDHMREVEAGELLVIHGDTLAIEQKAIRHPPSEMPRFLQICLIELLYSMYPTSFVMGRTVKKIRERGGWELAQSRRPDADIVVGVPDSGLAAARGFAAGSGIPLVDAITRYHYSERLFYTGLEARKDELYRYKFDVSWEDLHGKRIVLVDDTMFEGMTMKNVIKLCLLEGGAQEVHIAIPAPMITRPCYYGTPTSADHRRLIAEAHNGSAEEILQEIRVSLGEVGDRVKSLRFLSLKEVKQAVVNTTPVLAGYDGITTSNFCDACFLGGTRHIPVDVD